MAPAFSQVFFCLVSPSWACLARKRAKGASPKQGRRQPMTLGCSCASLLEALPSVHRPRPYIYRIYSYIEYIEYSILFHSVWNSSLISTRPAAPSLLRWRSPAGTRQASVLTASTLRSPSNRLKPAMPCWSFKSGHSKSTTAILHYPLCNSIA